MFTGLIVERGRVTAPPAPSAEGGLRLRIAHGAALAERLEIGASLAVAGVCLTVTSRSSDTAGEDAATASPVAASTVELSPETLRRTMLGELAAGDEVNLEPALRLGDPLGGHWVQGHVDGLAEVTARRDAGAHRELALAAPARLGRYLAEKGSVTLDGVSLTVASPPRRIVAGGEEAVELTVALIPHTLDHTTLGGLEPGDRVHLEVDVLAKYVERLLGRDRAGADRAGEEPTGDNRGEGR